MRRYVSVAILAVVVAGLAGAQSRWGGVPCPQLADVAQAQPVVWEWRFRDDTPGQAFLFRGNVQAGAWDGVKYLPIVGDQWGAACAPPIDPPAGMRGASILTGVDESKLLHGGRRYEINGREATRADAIASIGENKLPVDAPTRLVVIGSKAARDRVAKDLAADELRESVTVWSVPPDHWSVAGAYKTDADPTIYAQAADGRVLHRQDGYSGPGDFAALRKKIKPYDPAKDSDLRKVDAPGSRQALAVGGVLAILAGAVVMAHRKKGR